jgi:hypothetical protein
MSASTSHTREIGSMMRQYKLILKKAHLEDGGSFSVVSAEGQAVDCEDWRHGCDGCEVEMAVVVDMRGMLSYTIWPVMLFDDATWQFR